MALPSLLYKYKLIDKFVSDEALHLMWAVQR
jgi:hypothetical protein